MFSNIKNKNISKILFQCLKKARKKLSAVKKKSYEIRMSKREKWEPFAR